MPSRPRGGANSTTSEQAEGEKTSSSASDDVLHLSRCSAAGEEEHALVFVFSIFALLEILWNFQVWRSFVSGVLKLF